MSFTDDYYKALEEEKKKLKKQVSLPNPVSSTQGRFSAVRKDLDPYRSIVGSAGLGIKTLDTDDSFDFTSTSKKINTAKHNVSEFNYAKALASINGSVSEDEEEELLKGMTPTQRMYHMKSGGFVDTSVSWADKANAVSRYILEGKDTNYELTDKLLNQIKAQQEKYRNSDTTYESEIAELQSYYNSVALAKQADILSKTKMDGKNHSVLQEMQLIAEMSGDEKKKRKEAVLKKMEELGVSTDDYALLSGDSNFTWGGLGKTMLYSTAAGLSGAWKRYADTGDFVLGKLGWEDSPFAKISEYYGGLNESYQFNAQLHKERLGGGAGWDFATDAVQTTAGSIPDVLMALATAGTSTTNSLTYKAAYETAGNWLGRTGLQVSQLMKNPRYWTTFAGTLGSDYNEFREMGASDEVATAAAVFTSLINAGIEQGLDGGSGIQGFADDLVSGNKNKVWSYIESIAEESGEEGLQKFVTESVTKVAVDHDADVYNPKEYGREMALGGVSAMVIGGGQTAVQSGVNAYNQYQANKLTVDEQTVVDKVTESLIAQQQEKSDKELSKSEKNKIAKTARTLVEKGYVKAETIESILGGESYEAFKSEMDTFFGGDDYKSLQNAKKGEESLPELQKEYDTLHAMKRGDMTGQQIDREAELKEQIEAIKNAPKSADLKAQLDASDSIVKLSELQAKLRNEVYGRVKNSRLAESYRELARRNEKFTADVSKYTNESARKTVQNILDSGLGDGTNQFRDTVELMARISADHNEVIFSLTDTDGIKGAGHYKAGYHTNGYVTDDGKITLNYDSPNMLESIVGHEITHVLEKAGHYKALQRAIFDYAISKEGLDKFNARLKAAEEAYRGKKNTSPEGEVAADLIGEYLFTDYNFISNLAKTDMNTFQKVWNEVKYMFKVAVTGSKEARQLEKAKHMFEKAYNENLKGKVKPKAETEENVKLSLENVNKSKYNKRSKRSETETLFLSWENGSAHVGEVKKFVRFGKIRYYEKTENGCVELSRSQYNERNGTYAEDIDRRAERRFGTTDDYDESTQRGTPGHSDSYRDTDRDASVFGQAIREKLSNDTAGSVSSTLGHDSRTDINQSEYDDEASGYLGASFTFSNDYQAIRNFMKEGDTGESDVQYSLSPVEAVEPHSDLWHRTATTEEAMAKFPDMWNVATEESEVRNPTQITTTVKSYRKIYEFLKNEGFNGTILDASSGLGYGTKAGIEEFGFDVEDIEPYPDKGYQPKYTDYSALDKKYDVIISNAVLNVLPQDQRDALVAKMGELLNDGGRMFINVRGKDVDSLAKTGKNIHLGDMEWIETVKGSYQKGFTKNELKAYLEDALGDGFTVEKTNMFGAVSVVVTKDSGVKHSFTKDSDGNQLTKAQQEFFKDSKMRDANGNLKPMYHGTTRGGFHTFDHGYSDDDLSFFFVDDNDVASSYSGTYEVYEAKTMQSAEDMNRFLASIGQAEDYQVVEENGKFILKYFGDEVASSDTAKGIYEEFCDYEGVGNGDVNYKVYLNLKNPLVIDAEGRDWHSLPSVNGDKSGYEYIKVIEVGDGIGDVTIEYAMYGDPAPVRETVDLYERFDDGLADTLSNLAPGEKVEGVYANPSTTRDYAKYAKENGYDGVIFENIYDIGGYGNNGASEATVAIAFDSTQIKSTANENPTADPDIRYSYSSIANSFFGNESLNTKEFLEADYTKTQGYKDYVEQCLNNFRQSRGTTFDEVAARLAIEDSIRGIVDVAVASKQAGYDIFDDAQKRTTQDSKNRLLFSSLEPNSDYFTSNDISTICDKRQNFAEIYDEIVRQEEAKGVPAGKRFFDNINNYFAIHKIMADKGLTTPCRQCYVESMRKNLAPMASAFLRLVGETNPDNTANDQLYHQTGKNKGNLKVNNASTREAVLSIFEANPQYPIRLEDLTIEMLTTEEGLARLRLQAPLVYEAFNSFYGQAKPKMPKSATPFRFGELTALLTDNKGNINQRLISLINSTGGFRLQSYSDFQIKNYVDVLQVLFEAGTLGLNGHAYTKVPAFLDATEGTNLKRNISIFMYKDGDEWKLDRNDSFPYSLDEIYELVNGDKTGNTSIIAVSQNKEMSAWIMANDYVGYGIPFHKSGLKMSTVRDTVVRTEDGRDVRGYTGTIDHTKQQTEVWKDTEYNEKGEVVHKKETKVKNGINIYSLWDFENKANLSKNELIKKNLMAYIDACEDAGYLPKFRDYVMNNDKVLRDVLKYSKELGFVGENATIDDISFEYKGYRIPYGYYKFLGDFGMFTPDGKASPQKTLSLEDYDFEKAKAFFSDAESLRRNEILQQFANGTVRDGFRDSDMETEDLENLVKQKRSEVANEALGSKRSLTKETENAYPYGNYPATDNRVYDPLAEFAPVREDVAQQTAPTPDVAPAPNTATVAEMFSDEPATVEQLYARQDEIKDLLYSALDSGDQSVIDELSIEYENIREQIAEMEDADADRFDSLDDADAPPETDIAPFERADAIPLTKKAAQDIARDIRQKLGLSNKHMRDVHALIEEYSQSEFPDREQLFREIKTKFGTYTESTFDETVKEAKSYLRTYGLFVSDAIKSEIADYADIMRKNRGRIRFSKEGTDVDVLYHELNELFPNLFPEDIIAPTDQFWQMVEVANMDAESNIEQQLPDDAIWDVANAVADSVADYKQTQREKAANKHGRESFNSLMENADQFVPPINLEQVLANRRKPMGTDNPDAPVAEIYDTKHKKGVVEGQQAMWDDPVPETVGERRKLKMEEHTETWADTIGDTSTWKDLPLGLLYKTKTLRRILRTVVRDANGKPNIELADRIYDMIETKYDHNEALLKRESAKLKEVFDKLKLNHHEDTYAHMLGELRHNPETTLTQEVVDEFYRKHKRRIDTKKVDTAIAEARKTFDELIVRVNTALREQGFKEIPYRKGYFPHFTNPKQGWLAKLLNWKTVDTEIPTSIAGLTEQFKPQRSWQSFNKERKGDATDYSLYQGLDTYIHGALDWIYHIDDLQSRRALENYLRYIHSEEGVKARIDEIKANKDYDADEAQKLIDAILAESENPLSGLVRELMNRTNTLANKKAAGDRKMEDDTNRKVYSVMTNLNSRINANMVVGSFSSALTNFIPMVQSWHQVSPVFTVKGLGDFVRSVVHDDGMVGKSDFLTNRLVEEEKLYQTGWDKVTNGAAFLMNTIDNITSQTVWRSKYLQNLHEKMSEAEAIKDADQFAKNLMAGRSRGNAPTIFDEKNPVTKLFTAFQLEVANQYGYMFDDVPKDSKNFARLVKGYATAFLGAYVYNALYSSLVGRNAAFDPISILEDLFKDLGWGDDDDEEKEPEDIALNLVDNILEEVPFVGGLVGGGRVPISSALPYEGDYKTFISDAFNGEVKAKEMLKPLYYLAMPVGGGQIKKTVEGLSMFDDDLPVTGSYTDSGALRFPVEDTIGNRIQAGLFGQYASENARYYFDNDIAPLGAKQIQEYQDVDIPIRDYWDYRKGLGGLTTAQEKADYINSLDLPISKKNILINNQLDRKEPIDMTDYDDFGSLEEFDYATKNPKKYAFFDEIGITYQDYKNASEEEKDVYNWAYEYPEKYALSKSVTKDLFEYKKYTDYLYDIRADKDSNGKSISGSAKAKKKDYIFSLDIDVGAKFILYKSAYPSVDDYNEEIVEYLNSKTNLTYDERVAVLRELGFTVKNGTVYWD